MSKIRGALCLVCVTFAFLTHPPNTGATPLPTQAYQFTVIDLPLLIPSGGRLTQDLVRFTDINASNTLIGTDFMSDGFIIELPQTVLEIHCPDDTTENDVTAVSAINNAGDIVGYCSSRRDGVPINIAFLRTADGTITLLNYPGANGTAATGINDAGEIVGWYWGQDLGVGLQRFHGFHWQAGIFTALDAPFDGAMTTIPQGINNAGQVMGTYLHHPPGSPNIDDYDTQVAFLMDGGTWTVLAVPGVVQPGCCSGTTFPMDINNRGQVLGATYDAQGQPAFFLYRNGIYTLITGVPTSIAESDVAWGLNDRGTLAGTYVLRIPCADCGVDGRPGFRNERHGFVAHPVRPVPTPLVDFVVQVWGDFNQDDSPDLAGVTEDEAIYWCLTGEPACTQLPGAAISLAAGDFTRQGHDELVALASDTTLWFFRDGQNWEQLPGYLRTLVSRKLRDGTSQLAGIAWDQTIWTGDRLGQWRQIPGRLRTMIVGDFLGNSDPQLAGLAWDDTIWYTPDLRTFQRVQGWLRTLRTVPGMPDGMEGLAEDGTFWRAETLGAWHQVPTN
jgi:hypothetical protein